MELFIVIVQYGTMRYTHQSTPPLITAAADQAMIVLLHVKPA